MYDGNGCESLMDDFDKISRSICEFMCSKDVIKLVEWQFSQYALSAFRIVSLLFLGSRICGTIHP